MTSPFTIPRSSVNTPRVPVPIDPSTELVARTLGYVLIISGFTMAGFVLGVASVACEVAQ